MKNNKYILLFISCVCLYVQNLSAQSLENFSSSDDAKTKEFDESQWSLMGSVGTHSQITNMQKLLHAQVDLLFPLILNSHFRLSLDLSFQYTQAEFPMLLHLQQSHGRLSQDHLNIMAGGVGFGLHTNMLNHFFGWDFIQEYTSTVPILARVQHKESQSDVFGGGFRASYQWIFPVTNFFHFTTGLSYHFIHTKKTDELFLNRHSEHLLESRTLTMSWVNLLAGLYFSF